MIYSSATNRHWNYQPARIALCALAVLTLHAANAAPVVSAGPDIAVTIGTPLRLLATFSDDGLPGGGTFLTWSQVSQPTGGVATFSSTTSSRPGLSFSLAGTYVLRVTANDGALSASDDVSIVVEPTSTAFTIIQQAFAVPVGGDIKGFGMLARYAAPGPGQVRVRRTTTVPTPEPLAPICTARVYDPSGALAAMVDLSALATGTRTDVITVPSGAAGIWRVSITGGRSGDRYEIALPTTANWGVRGEFGLGFSPTTPSPAYLYVPASSVSIGLEKNGRITTSQHVLSNQAGTTTILTTPNGSGRWWIKTTAVTSLVRTVLRLNLAGLDGDGVVMDGMPMLLCPTPAAANDLQAGTVNQNGLATCGPLQARARAWIVNTITAGGLGIPNVAATLPATVAGVVKPQVQAQLYGQYAPLNSMIADASSQILNTSDPFAGSVWHATTTPPSGRPAWNTFRYGDVQSPFDASGFAAAAGINLPLNPLYGNVAVAKRAALAAFYHISGMWGDGLIREGDYGATGSPVTHAFFVYEGSLAGAMRLAAPLLDAEGQAIWREGIMQTGDVLANFRGFESNQWWHMVLGHLHAYQATNQIRFLRYFESQAQAMVDGVLGSDAKHGQHPAGYFLEEYGPDGFYDHISTTMLNQSYYIYKDLPAANPAVTAKLSAAIQKNLVFKQYHWLRQPSDGEILSSYASNCRRLDRLGKSTWPSEYLARADFPLALSKLQLNPVPSVSGYPATVFPYLVSNDAWAWLVLQDQVPLGTAQADATREVQASWTIDAVSILDRPITVSAAALPQNGGNGVWELPGQIAFKRGSTYGVVFYDVAGAAADRVIAGWMGGGPSALWTALNGSVLLSQRVDLRSTFANESAIAHACVYGRRSDGSLFVSGKERSTLTWLTAGQRFRIRSTTSNPVGTIDWIYTLESTGCVFDVDVNMPGLTSATVNLPLLNREPGTVITLNTQTGRCTHTVGANTQTLNLPIAASATLSAPVTTPVGTNAAINLRLALTASGSGRFAGRMAANVDLSNGGSPWRSGMTLTLVGRSPNAVRVAIEELAIQTVPDVGGAFTLTVPVPATQTIYHLVATDVTGRSTRRTIVLGPPPGAAQ